MALWFSLHTRFFFEKYTTLDKIEPTHALGANIVSELIPSTGMGDNTLFHDEKWRVVEGASSIPNLLHINLKELHMALHIPNMIEQRLYLGVSKKGINHRDKFRTAAFATGQQQNTTIIVHRAGASWLQTSSMRLQHTVTSTAVAAGSQPRRVSSQHRRHAHLRHT